MTKTTSMVGAAQEIMKEDPLLELFSLREIATLTILDWKNNTAATTIPYTDIDSESIYFTLTTRPRVTIQRDKDTLIWFSQELCGTCQIYYTFYYKKQFQITDYGLQTVTSSANNEKLQMKRFLMYVTRFHLDTPITVWVH